MFCNRSTVYKKKKTIKQYHENYNIVRIKYCQHHNILCAQRKCLFSYTIYSRNHWQYCVLHTYNNFVLFCYEHYFGNNCTNFNIHSSIEISALFLFSINMLLLNKFVLFHNLFNKFIYFKVMLKESHLIWWLENFSSTYCCVYRATKLVIHLCKYLWEK